MSQPTSRLFGLDLLRAFAILSVVYSHGQVFVGHHFSRYHWFDFDGVSIFFVLSGFLIGGILINQIERQGLDAPGLFNFWGRRWMRTLPAYFVVLLLLLVLYICTQGKLPPQVWLYAVFSQNMFSAHPAFFPEAWSLAVEEWFYFLVPLGIYLSLRFSKGSARQILLGWVILIILGITAFRLQRSFGQDLSSIEIWDLQLRKQVVTRLDAIMYGFLGAWLQRYHQLLWQSRTRSLLALGLLLMLTDKVLINTSTLYREYLSFTVVSVGTLALLPYLSQMSTPRLKFVRWVGFISAISYSMYLLNLSLVRLNIIPVMVNLLPNWLTRDVLVYGAYWVLTIFLSWLLYRCVEKPVLGWRDRYFVLLPRRDNCSRVGINKSYYNDAT